MLFNFNDNGGDMNALEMALEALTNPSTIAISHAIKLIREELAKISTEPPDYVEPPTSDYHNFWEEGFKAGMLCKPEQKPQFAQVGEIRSSVWAGHNWAHHFNAEAKLDLKTKLYIKLEHENE